MQNMSQKKNKDATFKACSDLIEKQIGLDKAANAIKIVDALTNGEWSKHIDELGFFCNSDLFFKSKEEQQRIANWHYQKLELFIKIYKKGLGVQLEL